MGRTLNQKIAQLPSGRQERINKRGDELINEEISLRELRKALELTQVDIAARLGVGQDTVSRYEQRTDMLLSTLHSYLQALGGRLTITAEFPDRKPVRISTFGELNGAKSNK